MSEETRRKISEANKNPSEEKRKHMSEIRKGNGLRGTNPNAKKVIRLSDGKIYNCMKDAAEDNHVNYSTFKSWVHKGKDFTYYTENNI